MQGPGSSCPPLAVPPNLASRAPRGRAAPAPLTCRHHVCCCCLPCSSSSSPSSSSLPLPAAWGSLWRFIHSCLPIGPSAFPCLPEAERVTPRPFPATFCCHRAALPQAGAAAGLGHAWAAPGRGSVPQRGVRGMGGRGHGTDPPWRGTDCPWHPNRGGGSALELSAVPSAFSIPTPSRCPSLLVPTEQRLCGQGTAGPPSPAAPWATLALSFLLCSPLHPIPARLCSPSPAARTASRSAERCPMPAADRSADSSSERGGGARYGGPELRAARPVPYPPHPTVRRPSRPQGPLPPAGHNQTSSLLQPSPGRGYPQPPMAALRGAPGPYRQHPAAGANPESLGECEPCMMSGSTTGAADGGF